MSQDHSAELTENSCTTIPGFLAPEMLQYLRATSQTALDNLSATHREKFESTGSHCNFGDHPIYAKLVTLPDLTNVMRDFE